VKGKAWGTSTPGDVCANQPGRCVVCLAEWRQSQVHQGELFVMLGCSAFAQGVTDAPAERQFASSGASRCSWQRAGSGENERRMPIGRRDVFDSVFGLLECFETGSPPSSSGPDLSCGRGEVRLAGWLSWQKQD
jgi:hypothetical protein